MKYQLITIIKYAEAIEHQDLGELAVGPIATYKKTYKVLTSETQYI